jgi:hypothetical protein
MFQFFTSETTILAYFWAKDTCDASAMKYTYWFTTMTVNQQTFPSLDQFRMMILPVCIFAAINTLLSLFLIYGVCFRQQQFMITWLFSLPLFIIMCILKLFNTPFWIPILLLIFYVRLWSQVSQFQQKIAAQSSKKSGSTLPID